MPTLQLLGPVLLDGRPLPDERSTHLLVLLATQPGGCSRAQAAGLMWPGQDAPAALSNLRKTLYRLRADGLGLLLAPGERLLLVADTDWAQAQASPPADALPLWRGPLADGLRDDAGWLGAARERALALWRRTLLAALPALDDARAEAELERLRSLDPLDEPLARAHLQRLHAAGRRDAFQRVRAAFVRALGQDLGVAPPPDLDRADPPAADPNLLLPPAARAQQPLVGRDDELAAIASRLEAPGAALVLRGTAGIGKTRLAAAAAEQAARRGVAVVWWRLADLQRPADAWARLATELGLEQAAEARIAAALAARPTLLVADDPEHLAHHTEPSAAGRPAESLLHRLAALRLAAPGLRLLLTSRSTLDGLPELPVGPLDMPDPADPPGAVLRSASVRLLCARTLALDAGFDARSQAAALGRIARAAGGHALALELAAARLRHARADEVAAAMEAGHADLDTLFQAMWAALQPPLRQALALLAALPPGFGRALAEAVAGLPPSRFDALAARSLVEPEPGATRWRLHPLLRLWLLAQQPLPAAQATALQRRATAEVVATLARRLAREAFDAPALLAWLGDEQPLLQAALRQAAADADADALDLLVTARGVWIELSGRTADGMALLADLAQLQRDQPAAARAPVQAARALLNFRQGRWSEALALADLPRNAPPRARIIAARTRGLVLWRTGDLAGARRWQQRALDIGLQAGLDGMLANTRYNLAILDGEIGRLADCERGFLQAAELAQAFGSVSMQVRSLNGLALCAHMQGRAGQGLPLLHQALALIDRHGLFGLALSVRLNLATQQLAGGALAAFGDDLPRLREAAAGGEAALRWMADLLTLRWHVRCGRPAAALACARAAWQQVAALDQPLAGAALACAAAELWAAQGRTAQAAAWLAWALRDGALGPHDGLEAQAQWQALGLDAAAEQAAREAAAGLDLGQLGTALLGDAAG